MAKRGRPPKITPEQAARALLGRRRARRGLLGFAEYMHPQWETGPHHKLICDKLDEVVAGTCKRLILNAPPRHSKTELTSRQLVAHYLGKHPNHQIILASYSDRLAQDNSRDARNIIKEQEYIDLCGYPDEGFPGCRLDPETTAGERWETLEGGVVIAAGIGGAITGRGGHLIVVDDPLKDRADADSARIRETVWKWYNAALITRAMPGAAIVIMQCMTGDTPVLMGDGTEKHLRHIRPGDTVATYDKGEITTSRVANWKSSGIDSVFKIKTRCGNVVKANARHPFLVDRGGRLEWVRLKNLKPKERILRVTGENGRVSYARKRGVGVQQNAKECVQPITTSTDGRLVLDLQAAIQNHGVGLSSSTTMGLPWKSMAPCWRRRVAFALYAETLLQLVIQEHTGTGSSALTTATRQEKSEGFCATTATSLSGTEKANGSCSRQQNICVLDEIESITPAGKEEVFDVEIERTENFIAGGLISHNTRWHEDDLAGLLMKYEGEDWETLILPAIENEGTSEETALWEDRYSLEYMHSLKKKFSSGGRMREWYSLYQQNPSPEEGTYMKRDWFQERYDVVPDPINVYMASDFAVTDKSAARDPDWTVHGVFGIGEDDRLYVLDWWRGRTTPDEWIPALFDLVERWKPITWWGEKGQIRRAVEGQLDRTCRERKTYFNMEWVATPSDKSVRGRPFQAWAKMNRIILPNTSLAGQALENWIGFPTLRHDDDFDVASLVCLQLDEMHRPVPQIVQKKRRDPYAISHEVSDNRWKCL